MDLKLVLIEIATNMRFPESNLSISSTNLGRMLGVSQQTASRYLKLLSREDFIDRTVGGRGQEIKLTKKGLQVLREINSNLSDFLSQKTEVIINGRVKVGLGEGAYYVREYAERIGVAVGYHPFYGTLNVKLDERLPNLGRYPKKVVKEFIRDGRSFGEIKIFPVELNHKKNKILCHLILPERTHYREEVELIHKENLRKKFNIKDRDMVSVKLRIM